MVSGHVPGSDISPATCHQGHSKGLPEELSFQVFQPPGLFLHKSWKIPCF